MLRTRLYDYDSLSRDEFMGKAAVVIESQVEEESNGEVQEIVLAQEGE